MGRAVMVKAVMPEESSPQAYRRGHKRLYCKIESEALARDNYTITFQTHHYRKKFKIIHVMLARKPK